jgi:RimK-like ATP-grasp domain
MRRMKRIAVYFDAPAYNDYPFNVPEYVEAYHEIARKVTAKGAQFFIVRQQATYAGGSSFSKGWLFTGEMFVPHESPVECDLIYDKGHFEGDPNAKLLNDVALDEICTDKWKSYQLFQDKCPKTFLVHSPEELDAALSALSGDKIVAKPQGGAEGKGVLIDAPEKIREGITSYPYLLQEFLDTSGGIPGIVDGLHDFRLILINGEVAISYVRTPPPGQLRANVAQGGKEISVPRSAIPPETLDVLAYVDPKLSSFVPRLYSLDMGRDRDGTWKIIELNSKPAVSADRLCADYPDYQQKLVDLLVASA